MNGIEGDAPVLAIRATSLYVPIALAVVLAMWRRPGRRQVAAAVVATGWNIAALLPVNVVAQRLGWWELSVDGGVVAGVPVDLWLGWAMLWGVVPAVVRSDRLLLVGAALVAFDVVAMPLADPVVGLGPSWLVGEAVAVTVALVPGLLLVRWTARSEHVHARVALQAVAFTTLMAFVLPSVVMELTDGSWAPLLERARWQLVTAGVVLAPAAAMAIQAVIEFARHGGTPVPLDPPPRLVTSGPYAYVANPMQLSAVVLLAGWAALLGSMALLAAAAMGVAFSAGVAALDEERDLSRRFGEGWGSYRSEVRLWLPRWRPLVSTPAVVYVSEGCDPCQEVGRFLRGLRSTGLEVEAAEGCAFELRRVTHVQDGRRSAGVAAIGRSLEHVSLAWACLSWIARIPGVQQVLQLVADGVGGGPRTIERVAA